MPLLYRWMVWTQKSFHLLPLFISFRSWGEKLIKYQSTSSCVTMSVILMTTLFYKALILQGEIWCWSLKRTVTNVSTTSTVVIFTNLKENLKCSKWRSKFQSRFFFHQAKKINSIGLQNDAKNHDTPFIWSKLIPHEKTLILGCYNSRQLKNVTSE